MLSTKFANNDKNKRSKRMDTKKKNNSGNVLKGLAVGCAIATAVTVVIATNKKKSKKALHNITDNFTNMLSFK